MDRRRIRPISPRLLECSSRRQQLVVPMRSTNELQDKWEAARDNAARHRDSGAARQGDHKRQKHPVNVRLKSLSCNLGWKSLLNREGSNGDGWACQDVERPEEFNHLGIDARANALRALHESGYGTSRTSGKVRFESAIRSPRQEPRLQHSQFLLLMSNVQCLGCL